MLSEEQIRMSQAYPEYLGEPAEKLSPWKGAAVWTLLVCIGLIAFAGFIYASHRALEAWAGA
ncbi:hypothetical protein [Mesorhizobium caraganae]|uniref:hypothetical protein n=1 Tax=Mesorhizobium caraganae TaxID=483206 RepID=UPI001787416B|nr:hypothetical protein [Mesorhizobium caraganae]